MEKLLSLHSERKEAAEWECVICSDRLRYRAGVEVWTAPRPLSDMDLCEEHFLELGWKLCPPPFFAYSSVLFGHF